MIFLLLTMIYVKISICWQHFFINTNFIEHNRHFLSTYFSSGSVRTSILLLLYSGGIDRCICHNCMYPKYFLPDFRPSSAEGLLQK